MYWGEHYLEIARVLFSTHEVGVNVTGTVLYCQVCENGSGALALPSAENRQVVPVGGTIESACIVVGRHHKISYLSIVSPCCPDERGGGAGPAGAHQLILFLKCNKLDTKYSRGPHLTRT